MGVLLLKLYVAGHTPRSEHTIANLRRICEAAWPDQYELVVIDVLACPHLAAAEQILATPTLIRTSPPPLRRIVGDLSSANKVLSGLELPPYARQIRRDNTLGAARHAEAKTSRSRLEGYHGAHQSSADRG